MEQFNLDTWLQDKSCKVVTRDGRPVRIVCWDVKSISPIIGIIQDRLGGEFARNYALNGRYSTQNESEYDLFFADDEKLNSIIDELKSYLEKTPKEQVEKDWKEIQDWYNHHFTNEEHNEEEKLTEFEKCVQNILNEPHFQDIEAVKQFSKTLLDLARKEIQPEIDKEIYKAYKNIDTIVYDNGYKQGQYEIMEDLPKWKKAKKDEELDCHVAIQQDDRVVLSDFVQKDEYYITLNVLKKLPKEE